ncbi:SpoIIE family protein phosphatase [Streptomyces polyrhachis]|uniref:SpoIIE family protein phosphatase n=1 Tax=Streptomyces polyrhachis TaxID=1282885 RepID=A0ABW2GP65_9ACTN
MNFTRWSPRLPGTARRTPAAAPAGVQGSGGPVPAARAEAETEPPGPPGPLAAAGLTVAETLGRLPAPVAVVHGPHHRVCYVNEAYTHVFGPTAAPAAPRAPSAFTGSAAPTDPPAAEALPELAELGVLPLLDQALRSARPRTAKARRVPGGRSFTFTCTPLDVGGTPGVLLYGADVTDQVAAAEKLREGERQQREAAVALQRSLLPQRLEQPDDLRVAATYQPGGTDAAVGGDWYDVITLGAGRTALVIGDVMGRGVRAAAVMGQLRTAVRAYARLDLPPQEVLQLIDAIATQIDPEQIATCVYAVHDPNDGTLAHASAGHVPLLIRDPEGTVRRIDTATGPPLGTGGWVYDSGTVEMRPGSTAVLYTDGLIERRGEDIEDALAALEHAFAGASGAPAVVCDRLVRTLGVTAEHDDDVAVLVFQNPRREGPEAELFRGAALDLLGGVEAAPRARAFASGVLVSWRFPTELHDAGVLAASELVANSLQHGIPPMRLRLRRTDRHLIIEVTDGDDRLPRHRQADPADENGRGLSIVASLASTWGARLTPGGGKTVWCQFTLPRPAP